MTLHFRSNAETNCRSTRKSAVYLNSPLGAIRRRVSKTRTFFHVGGLGLTADLVAARRGVKELAGLSGGHEQIMRMDRQ